MAEMIHSQNHRTNSMERYFEPRSNAISRQRASQQIRKQMNLPIQRGVVYFVTNFEVIKIGFSTQLHIRLPQLELRYKEYGKLTLIATLSGNSDDEIDLHESFEYLRLPGKIDWFYMNADILRWIFKHTQRSERFPAWKEVASLGLVIQPRLF